MDSTGTGKEVEDETRDDQQPSTSTGLSSNATTKDDEMSRLLQATDEILENKAKSMNLSSLNVRSILHHLIKYPSAIDVLLGIQEDENLPSVRNTRSRKKPDDSGPSSAVQTPKKFALRIEDKGPKNFLDLEYEEDDEFDADYVEEEGGKDAFQKGDAGTEEDEDDYDDDDIEDEEEENEEEESFGEEIPAATGTADKSFPTHDTSLNTLLFEEEQPENFHITLNDTVRPDSTAPVATLDTVVDDEDYAYFVKSLKFPADGMYFKILRIPGMVYIVVSPWTVFA
uniref:Uncharacterized protein n=1 Tax=Caenorhabditis japonica TaxID=281687 RepID=A0A8R1IE21_CAEJA